MHLDDTQRNIYIYLYVYICIYNIYINMFQDFLVATFDP